MRESGEGGLWVLGGGRSMRWVGTGGTNGGRLWALDAGGEGTGGWEGGREWAAGVHSEGVSGHRVGGDGWGSGQRGKR